MQYLINYDLFESRGNPIETRYSLPQLEKYANDPDVFISYRSIEKIGINPKTEFSTPNGIYAYHLQTMLEENWSETKLIVPFAGSQQWIYVFKPKRPDKILNLNNYKTSQLKIDRIKLARLILSRFKQDKLYDTLNEIQKRDINRVILHILHKADINVKEWSPKFGAKIWNMVRVASIIIDDFKSMGLIDLLKSLEPIRIEYITKKPTDHPVNLWSKIFITIGYEGVVDYGDSIIHKAEPSQAVFFNRAFIKVIDKIKNVDVSQYAKYSGDYKKVQIVNLCKKYYIRNYKINKDYSIDVKGGVDLSHKDLTKLPLKFNKVAGDFWCHNNQLTSLEGAPKIVNEDFACEKNNLTSLIGGPKIVKGNYSCNNNNLTNLIGSPNKVFWHFACDHNDLTSLEGAPKEVGGQFWCGNNARKFTEEDVRAVSNVEPGNIRT